MLFCKEELAFYAALHMLFMLPFSIASMLFELGYIEGMCQNDTRDKPYVNTFHGDVISMTLVSTFMTCWFWRELKAEGWNKRCIPLFMFIIFSALVLHYIFVFGAARNEAIHLRCDEATDKYFLAGALIFGSELFFFSGITIVGIAKHLKDNENRNGQPLVHAESAKVNA